MKLLVVLLPILLCHVNCSDYPPIPEPYTLSWTAGPLVWPSGVVRNMYKVAGRFNAKNLIATRAVIFRDDVFAIFPRFLPGVPATLTRTSLLSLNCQPTFEPFPSWEAQTEGDCRALQNPVELFLDRRDVLWVLDTGVTQTLATPIRQCPPKAVGYDLITGKQKFNVDLSDLATNSSRLQYIVADFSARGADTRERRFLYISDAAERALLVYNLSDDSSYRVLLPETVEGGCTAGGPDVLYLALAKLKSGGRRLFLTYLCGDSVFSIDTTSLQNGTDGGAVDTVSGVKPGKMVIIGTDNMCTIYFRYEGKGDVYSWDVNMDLGVENIRLEHCGDCCLLATHAVLDPLRSRMRILESNFLDFLRNTVGVGATHVLIGI